ncbi:ribosomal protein S18-alanine N-acetyltransferase [Flexivirga meconopsidis]|uniref:ribosomal protein S18-alanine N-acetyltransferase n=1 Tax=Flexivirga meconopsidis TaxID=2977121 RepID=UPI00223EC166|nr:ribosomal protein S18-alanine N-acetyltransferase [Flexivirga meconopsidis]
MSAPTTTPHLGIRLRPVEWPDIETLTALDSELFPDDAWSAQSWWAELAGRPRRRYIVATEGDSVVGYAGVDCAGQTADVMTVGVAPAAQGSGLGRRLLDWMTDEATASGAEALLLEVRADNERARNLYLRAGFEQLQTRRGYYQPGNVDAHVMRIHLTTKAAT